jgi:hypothetical protein
MNHVEQLLSIALNYATINGEKTLGECFRGHHEPIENQDIESLLQMIHDEIEDQFYEDAPNNSTQDFLNKIKYIKDNYYKYR